MSLSLVPSAECALCPRLAAFRQENRAANPAWHNAPVPSIGALEARLLVVGMAPGLSGANRTGLPFTGDQAGALLSRKLVEHGFASPSPREAAEDGPALMDCRIVNAVRCVPPANLPEAAEVKACNRFLKAELEGMPRLRMVLALGVLAHAAVLRAYGLPASRLRFSHGAFHTLPDGLIIADSFHVSRYNTNTGRLTEAMFDQVLAEIRSRLGG
jgi:uracil-DNA glycosylase family 4